jgi:hypothetical protein
MEHETELPSVFRWRWVDDFMVEVVSDGEIGKADWRLFLSDLAGGRARLKGVLVLTKGGVPSAPQRAELRAVLEKGSPPLAAILTDSQLVRMALTALNYFLEREERPRPFAPHQLDDALEYLRMPPALWPECRNAIEEMQRELGALTPHHSAP